MIRRVISAASPHLPASSNEVAVYGGSSARHRVDARHGRGRAELAHRHRCPAMRGRHAGHVADHGQAAHFLRGELGAYDRPRRRPRPGLAPARGSRRAHRVSLVPGDQRPGERSPPEQLRVPGVPAAAHGIRTPHHGRRVVAEVSRGDRQQARQPSRRDSQFRPPCRPPRSSSFPANDRALTSSS